MAVPVQAATFHVATTGNDGNPGTSGQPWLTIGKANTTMVSGDTVIVHTGSYSNPILPTNSGTSDAARITYRTAGDGDVTLTGFTGSAAIDLQNKSWITVTGRDPSEPITDQHFIIQIPVSDSSSTAPSLIDLCGATGAVVENIRSTSTTVRSINFGIIFCQTFGPQSTSQFNIFRRSHITFNSATNIQDGVEDGIAFGGTAQFNLIEANTLDGGVRHITVNNQAPNATFNVIRGNVISDEDHTALSIYRGGPNHLVENNRLRGMRDNPSCVGPECNFGNAFQFGTTNLLVRQNTLFEGCPNNCGFDAGGLAGGFGGDNTDQPVLNYRVYNNTIVDMGGVTFANADFVNVCGSGTHHVGDGVLINNFFFDGNSGLVPRILVAYRCTDPSINDRFVRNVFGNPGQTGSEAIIISNDGNSYTLAAAKASLTNPTGPDFRDLNGFANVYSAAPGFNNYSLDDFSLVSSSPYIDTGSPLTQVAVGDAGSGTSLKVNDARFFYNVSGFPTWMGVQWDWIAVGSASNDLTPAAKVQIAGVNYITNTITLASSISRAPGNFVWLWKDTAGRQVVQGTAPDIGALEFVSGTSTTTSTSTSTSSTTSTSVTTTTSSSVTTTTSTSTTSSSTTSSSSTSSSSTSTSSTSSTSTTNPGAMCFHCKDSNCRMGH